MKKLMILPLVAIMMVACGAEKEAESEKVDFCTCVKNADEGDNKTRAKALGKCSKDEGYDGMDGMKAAQDCRKAAKSNDDHDHDAHGDEDTHDH